MKQKNESISINNSKLNTKSAAGNEQEFENIYKMSAGMVYNVALRITGDPFLAEETVQEVYLKVFNNLDKFENRSSITTWIYRITVHTAINIAKSRSHGKKFFDVLDENVSAVLSDPDDNVEKMIDQKSREELVKRMLASLEPRHRSYLVLREIQGLSYEEIAKIMGEKINSVRTHIKRAREQLIKLYGREANRDEM